MSTTLRLCALILSASACFSQGVGPGSDPFQSNGFVTDPPPPIGSFHHFMPGNLFTASVQLGVWLGNLYTPAQGVPVDVSQYPQLSSGYHTHETLVSQRPGATWVGSTHGVTNEFGVASFQGRFPPYAGWYSTRFVAFEFGTTGINNHVFYWTLNPNMLGEDPLVHYPNDVNVNADQFLYYDTQHSWNGIGGYDFYVTTQTKNQIYAASAAYKNITFSHQMGTKADLLNIRRCSLADGGALDNEQPGWSPNLNMILGPWANRSREQHMRGVECDIQNPDFLTLANAGAIIIQLANQGCQVGAATPTGVGLTGQAKLSYWQGSDVYHIVCSTAGSAY